MRARARVCVCVCVCVWRARAHNKYINAKISCIASKRSATDLNGFATITNAICHGQRNPYNNANESLRVLQNLTTYARKKWRQIYRWITSKKQSDNFSSHVKNFKFKNYTTKSMY